MRDNMRGARPWPPIPCSIRRGAMRGGNAPPCGDHQPDRVLGGRRDRFQKFRLVVQCANTDVPSFRRSGIDMGNPGRVGGYGFKFRTAVHLGAIDHEAKRSKQHLRIRQIIVVVARIGELNHIEQAIQQGAIVGLIGKGMIVDGFGLRHGRSVCDRLVERWPIVGEKRRNPAAGGAVAIAQVRLVSSVSHLLAHSGDDGRCRAAYIDHIGAALAGVLAGANIHRGAAQEGCLADRTRTIADETCRAIERSTVFLHRQAGAPPQAAGTMAASAASRARRQPHRHRRRCSAKSRPPAGRSAKCSRRPRDIAIALCRIRSRRDDVR